METKLYTDDPKRELLLAVELLQQSVTEHVVESADGTIPCPCPTCLSIRAFLVRVTHADLDISALGT